MTDHDQSTDPIKARDDFFKSLSREHVVMLTDHFTGELRARPMHAMLDQEEGCVYFLTAKDTLPQAGVEAHPNVVLTIAHTGANDYASIYGLAARIDDSVAIETFWSPPAKAFFDGPDDPRVCLLRVYLERAEVWKGDIAPLAAVKMGFAAVTGAKPSLGSVEHVDL
jgi:general stress protein 26